MTEQTAGAHCGETCRIECGKYLNIAGASELKNIFTGMVNNTSEITIDITDPERIDTAGIQILCGIVDEARSRRIKLAWSEEAEDHLKRIAAMLGIEEYLGLTKKTA